MPDEKDPRDSEISASITVTENSLEAKVKSRITSAVDRLCGGLIDIFGVKVERKTSRERANIDSERAISEAITKAVIARIESDPEFADRMIENHLRSIAQKQKNKDAVVEVAIEELKKLPPPNVVELQGASDSIDEDWLNMFEALAEKASTERMRQLFGKILSGEIRKPGAFSLTTLRVASELSQRTAQFFQEIVGVRLHDAILEFDTSDISKFLDLEVAGLINFDSAGILRKIKPDDKEPVTVNGDEVLAILEIRNPDEELVYPIIRLTVVGHELAALVPNDEKRALHKLIELFKDRIIKAELHYISGRDGESYVIEHPPFQTIEFGQP
jgi:hypothetical protein